MDVGIDPRLQQTFYNNAEYSYPTNANAGTFNADLPQYGFTQQQQQQQQQQLNVGQGSLQAAATGISRNGNMREGQGRSRVVDLRKRQSRTLSDGRGQSPIQPTTPLRPTASTVKQATGLVFKNSSSNFPSGGTAVTNESDLSPYVPLTTLQQSNINQPNSYFASSPPPERPSVPNPPPFAIEGNAGANPFDPTLALVPYPPRIDEWRDRLFNVTQPLQLSESEFLTYFPHVDNVYSHRSTQKYKRKPFISHYWDCRLKGRPSGTKKSDDPSKKKRKREKRERDLCDVKVKITEWFSREECEAQGLSHPSDGGSAGAPELDGEKDGLQIVMDNNVADPENAFGMLEPTASFPQGHPGANGKKWYTIQRVNNAPEGVELEADDGVGPLDHKHSLERSDQIKKNSVQRFLLLQEKEKRLSMKGTPGGKVGGSMLNSMSQRNYAALPYSASGAAARTTALHRSPVSSHLTFYANAFCPFAQRIWIALEIKEIPYQYVDIIPGHILGSTSCEMNDDLSSKPKEMLEVNPEGIVPCLKHGNWGIWESGIMMEYLEDLDGYLPLLPIGNAQLRAHCRLWVDHLNRKILPAFYALLLAPPPSSLGSAGLGTTPEGLPVEITEESHGILVSTLQRQITSLVNASHAIGPFFLGDSISYVDVAFAPWIIRLSRVMSYYRNFPRPEVDTRWQRWVDAVESDERVRRTISDDNSYHSVYRGVGEDGWDGRSNDAGWHPRGANQHGLPPADARARLQIAESGEFGAEAQELGRMSKKVMIEAVFAKKVVREEGFGLGGDLYGHLGVDPSPGDGQMRI